MDTVPVFVLRHESREILTFISIHNCQRGLVQVQQESTMGFALRTGPALADSHQGLLQYGVGDSEMLLHPNRFQVTL